MVNSVSYNIFRVILCIVSLPFVVAVNHLIGFVQERTCVNKHMIFDSGTKKMIKMHPL